MGTYGENASLTLLNAKPTARTSDSVVTTWEIEFELSYSGFTRSFSNIIDVSNENKTASQFTQSGLLSLCNLTHFRNVFDSIYVSTNANTSPESVDSEFLLNNMPAG